jgi:RNA polymerase sigma-70 factor (ECF subfamily)
MGAATGEALMSGGLRNQLLAHLPALQRYALSLTGAPAEAERLVQASLERAARDQDQWRPGCRLDSWLFRIAQALWTEEQRTRLHAPPKAAAGPAAIAPAEAEAHLRRTELRAIEGAFGRLSEDQQAAVALVVLHGASYEEAAVAAGVPRPALASALAQARVALAAKVGDP